MKETPSEKLTELSRVIMKRRIVNLMDEFPQRLQLGTFKTEDLLVRIGHLLRELGGHLDNTRTEDLIYGKAMTLSLQELGDLYWSLGVELGSQRPKNQRKPKIHRESVASVERSGL